MATLVPKRFVLCCLGVFGGPIYCCSANRLCLVMIFTRITNLLLSLIKVCYSHCLSQKASLYPRVLSFFMDLPLCNGHSAIFPCVDRLSKYCGPIPCFVGEEALSASLVAKVFFDNVLGFFGVLAEVISDKDPKFTVFFW